jgi:gluconolactonase
VGDAADAGVSPPDGAASGWTCPTGLAGQLPTLAGATVTRIAGVPPPDDGGINQMGYGFSTIEGPVWMGTALFVSEFPGTAVPPSRILEIAPGGTVTVAGPAGWDPGSNGLAVDQSGVLYGAIHEDGSISTIDVATGTRTPIASTYNGKRFNSPNDLTIRSDGNIYFSDPNYQGSSANGGYPQGNVTGLYRVAAGTRTVTLIDGTLNEPNGVTLSLDEKTLYVSSKTNVLNTYPVDSTGAVGASSVFVSTLPSGNYIDGMVMDCAGNLYGAEITSGSNSAVIVLSSTGSVIGTLAVPNAFSATNVAFGGADHKTLYISAQGSGGGQQPPGSSAQGVYQVALDIPGMPY